MIPFAHKGVTAILNNRLGATLLADTMMSRFALPANYPATAQGIRNMWIMVGAYSTQVRGTDWQPPHLTNDAEALQANFEAFLELDEALVTAWTNAVVAMRAPLSPPEEQGGNENPTPANAG